MFVPGYRGPILTFLSEAWAWFYRVTGDKLNWPAFQSTYLGILARFSCFKSYQTYLYLTCPAPILPMIGSHRMWTKVCTRVQLANFNFPVRSLGIVLSSNWPVFQFTIRVILYYTSIRILTHLYASFFLLYIKPF